MNQAVGRPSAKATSVVRSDSLTERQKIDRCASARPTVSSKMSRWKKIENQASSVGVHATPEYDPGVRNE